VPNSRSTTLDERPSTQTTGPVRRAIVAIGRDTAAATRSGWRRASCFGTNSPSTSVRKVIATTTSTNDRLEASGRSIGTSASSGVTLAATCAPPNTPEKMLTTVMPTCTVGRNRCGSSASTRARAAPASPLRSSTARRARLDETSASSLIANQPLIRISSSMTRISTAMVMDVLGG